MTVQLPTFSFVTVTTTVSVPDGGTVLLGGIKRLSEGRNEFGVPILDKIPYLDRLFKNVGIGRDTSSLMMMVTPRIIIQEEEEEKMGIAPPKRPLSGRYTLRCGFSSRESSPAPPPEPATDVSWQLRGGLASRRLPHPRCCYAITRRRTIWPGFCPIGCLLLPSRGFGCNHSRYCGVYRLEPVNSFGVYSCSTRYV